MTASPPLLKKEPSDLDLPPPPPPQKQCLGRRRVLVALMLCIGFVFLYGMRCNIGAAVVRMTSNRTVKGQLKQAEYFWRPEQIGLVESAFYWSYCLVHIPGGILASMYPANRIFGVAIMLSGLLNMTFPFLASVDIGLIYLLRIIQGSLEGLTYPACHGILSKWAPPSERSLLATTAYGGTYFGVVFGMSFSNVAADFLNWTIVFYVSGGLCVVWGMLWFLAVAETPDKDTAISPEELKFIKDDLASESGYEEKEPVEFTKYYAPWKEILTSLPMHAIIFANFARTWTFYLLVLNEPQYFRQAFHMDKYESDLLMAVPHLCMAIVVPIGGKISDLIRRSGKLSMTGVRKLMNCGALCWIDNNKICSESNCATGFGMTAIFLAGVGYTTHAAASVVMLSLALLFSGFAISGYNVNHLDLAPHYASLLLGISNGIGTLSVLIVPNLTEYLTSRIGAHRGWKYTFWVAAGVHLIGVVHYGLFASGELQTWAGKRGPHTEAKGDGIKLRALGDDADDNEGRGVGGTPLTKQNSVEKNYGALGNEDDQ